jgi:hypothetical protein
MEWDNQEDAEPLALKMLSLELREMESLILLELPF